MHSECDPVFRDQSVHTHHADHLPFAFELVVTGCSLCFHEDPSGASELHGNELVTDCISLRCACHGTVLSLNHSPMTSLPSPSLERKSLVHVSVSGSECGAPLNFSITVLPTPTSSCALLAATVLQICIVQLPITPRSLPLGSMLKCVSFSVHLSMRTPFD